MSILIRGMTMPKTCDLDCPILTTPPCPIKSWNALCSVADGQRHPDCPLIEIPPHGRLIDKDALLEDIDSNHIVTPSDDGNLVEVYGAEKILAHIAYAPTVIEKDGE